MTDKTDPGSGQIITSSDILLHDAKTALMYEELRAAIDDGHESMTHADALAEIAAIRAENEKLHAELAAIGAGGVNGPLMGRASLAANAGSEPVALDPRHIRKFLQALQAGEMSVGRAVEILDAWVGGYYSDEMVPPPPADSCLIADDEFPMEIVRKLRSEVTAHPSPPEGMVGGWIASKDQMPPPGVRVFWGDADSNRVGYDSWAGDDYRWAPSHWMHIPEFRAPPTLSADSGKGE